MRAGVIVAMERELDALRAAGTDGARLAGIGKVNAACAAVEMILTERPDCIINSGVAGGLTSALSVGDVVVGESVAYHDVWCGPGNALGQVQGMPERYDADPLLLDAARRSCPGARFGLIASGDQFVDDGAQEVRISSMYPDALACDMESAAIAQVCRRYGVPFLCMRVVSDVPGAHVEMYEGFWRDLSQTSFIALEALLREIGGL